MGLRLGNFFHKTQTAIANAFFIDGKINFFAFFAGGNQISLAQNFKMMGDSWLREFHLSQHLASGDIFMLADKAKHFLPALIASSFKKIKPFFGTLIRHI